MGGRRSVVLAVVAVAVTVAACSPPQDSIALPSLSKPVSLASVTADLTTKLDTYGALAGQTPPTDSAEKLRSFYSQEDTALTDASAAFDSWSAYIDKAHAA